MASQADYDKVQNCIIEPLKKRYGEPDKGYLDDLIEELSHYPQSVLQGAWLIIRRNCIKRPSIQRCIAAANSEQVRQRPQTDTVSKTTELRGTEEKAESLAAKYMEAAVLNSALMITAKHEGWALPLIHYMQNAARMQANIITGIRNLGYDAMAMGYAIYYNPDEFDQVLKDFLRHSHEQAGTGSIAVTIPADLITRWKNGATRKAAANA